MQYCTNCKVHISTKTDFCPLCHKALTGDTSSTVQTFPKYQKPLKDKLKVARLVINLCAPFAIFVTVLINLLTFTGVLWSLIDTLTIIYLWIFGLWSFKKDGRIGLKIVANAIAINILLIGINIFGYNLATLPNELWSVTYVIPFLVATVLLVNNVFMFIKKHKIKEFIFSQFSLCFLAIGIFVFGACGFWSNILPATIVLGMALITIIMFSCLPKKTFKEELIKKFHI